MITSAMKEPCSHEKRTQFVHGHGPILDVHWCITCGSLLIGDKEEDWMAPERQRPEVVKETKF
jgi:hypothetical protein